MKKIISISICSMLSLILFFSISASSDSYTSAASDNIAPKERVYTDVDGKKIALKYSEEQTWHDDNEGDVKRLDTYGIYDIYEDKNGRVYLYLCNSDILCIKFPAESDVTNAKSPEPKDIISKKKARALAEKYLAKEFGSKMRGKYKFEGTSYSKVTDKYTIEYNYNVGKFRTNDNITVLMNYDGTIEGFSALYRERYMKYSVNDIDVKKLNKTLQNWDINDIWLTLDHNTGKLVPEYLKVEARKIKAPKLAFATKKITSKTTKIKMTLSKATKGKSTFVVCRKYVKGKATTLISSRVVKKNGKITLKVNLKKLKKGDKIKVYCYTILPQGNDIKGIYEKQGTSKVFTIK